MPEYDVPGDSWEERMAARTAGRRAVAEAERIAREAAALAEVVARDGWGWLNGWPQPPDGEFTVLIGSGVHCIGCGRFYGPTCVVFPADWEPPTRGPDWPFQLEACPICRA